MSNKSNLAEKVMNLVAEKLGHIPTSEELRNELSGAGLVRLAESIISEKPSIIRFAENIDSKLEEIPVPDIKGHVRCSECLSYDDWEYVDHDYSDSDEFAKEITYRCTAITRAFDEDNQKCSNDVTVYLDENNKPLFTRIKK